MVEEIEHGEKLPKSLYGYSIAIMLKEAGEDQRTTEQTWLYQRFHGAAAPLPAGLQDGRHPKDDIGSADDPQNLLILIISACCAAAQLVILYAVYATTPAFSANHGFCNELTAFSTMTLLAFLYGNAQTVDDIFSEFVVFIFVFKTGGVSHLALVTALGFILAELAVLLLVLVVGVQYLLTTDGPGNIVQAVMAVQFVNTLDNMLYPPLVPLQRKKAMDRLIFRSEPNLELMLWLPFFGNIIVIVFGIVYVIVNYYRVCS